MREKDVYTRMREQFETSLKEALYTDAHFYKLGQTRPEIDFAQSEKDERLRTFMNGMAALVELCGDTTERDGMKETPFRVAKAFLEYTKGYAEDPAAILGKSFDVQYDELVLVKDIPYNSLCEHHLAPFFGKAHVAYIPENNVITGLSKFARLVDAYAHRFQVQERLTAQIADTIEEVLNPLGAAVVVEGTHYCMCGRGVKKEGAVTVTSSMRGVFRTNDAARKEVLDLIKG